MSNISSWMSWEGGVDLTAATKEGLAMPNVIVHVARMVHTPVGSAPAGMVLWQPDPGAAPAVMGFLSPNAAVGAYFGPKIFAGTPFENAPVVAADISVEVTGGSAVSVVKVGGVTFEVELSGTGALERFHRPPAPMTPFSQDVIEASATAAALKVNGTPVGIVLPPSGIGGGAAAVFSPAGQYTR
jgi:hypothetical protein